MSTVTATSTREHRVTVRSLSRAKRKAEPITMLTAYEFTFARIFDSAGIDLLLVGDSLGNVVQGEETTLPVTLEESIYHTRIVGRGATRALVVADMPFGSYQVSPEDAVRNAIRFVKEAGAHAVKLEGGSAMLQTTERIVAAGGRADDWRFNVTLPIIVERLDRAAGLKHRELKARSLYIPGARAGG